MFGTVREFSQLTTTAAQAYLLSGGSHSPGTPQYKAFVYDVTYYTPCGEVTADGTDPRGCRCVFACVCLRVCVCARVSVCVNTDVVRSLQLLSQGARVRLPLRLIFVQQCLGISAKSAPLSTCPASGARSTRVQCEKLRYGTWKKSGFVIGTFRPKF